MCNHALVDSGWSESGYYDKRKDYMLKRVDDAYLERSVGSKMSTAEDQFKRHKDSQALRDDQPKSGEAVTLDRSSASRTVTDEDLAMIESQALLDGAHPATAYNGYFKQKYPTGSSSLDGARTVLGRAAGETPNVTYNDVAGFDEYGNEVMNREAVKDFRLSTEERERLKGMDRNTLLDRFYGTDTSKF